MKFGNSKPTYEKPTSGVGVVKLGKSTFSVDLEYSTGKNKKTGKYEYDTETFKFNLDVLEELDFLPEDFELKNGKSYFMSIKTGTEEILQLRPASGFYPVKFAGLAHSRDKDGDIDPHEILITEGDGEYGKFWQFVAELEVTDGPNAGIKYPVYLPLASEDSKTGEPRYKFYMDDGKFVVMRGPKSGEKVKMLDDLIQLSGIAEYSFKMDNDEEYEVQDVLAMIEKAGKKMGNTFSMLVEKGYPKTLTADENAETDEIVEDVEEEVEEKPVKKSVKKVVEVVEDDEEEAPKKAKKRWVDED